MVSYLKTDRQTQTTYTQNKETATTFQGTMTQGTFLILFTQYLEY